MCDTVDQRFKCVRLVVGIVEQGLRAATVSALFVGADEISQFVEEMMT